MRVIDFGYDYSLCPGTPNGGKTLEFEINKVCIDSLAVESSGFNPTSITFLITVKNFSPEKRTIFKDTVLGSDVNFGRLLYFDAAKKCFYYSIITPIIDYWDNVSRDSLEVKGNDSTKFVGEIYLHVTGKLSNYKLRKISAEFLISLVTKGRFFYLPGAFKKTIKRSAKLPAEAVEIKKKGPDIFYSGNCRMNK